jgi:DNA-binding response OmpR family regulator
MSTRVLVVESDREMASLLRDALIGEGHAVDTPRAREAVARAHAFRPEVILLDWPERAREGRELCLELQRRNAHALLVTSVRSSGATLRAIFESGADDVMRKPFDLEELLLRVHALARRTHARAHGADVLRVGAIRLEHGQAVVGDEVVLATQRELAMLTHLARRADRTVTIAELATSVWGRGAPTSNAIVAHVNHLRSKLGPAAAQLRTVRGVGYVLSSGGADDGRSQA